MRCLLACLLLAFQLPAAPTRVLVDEAHHNVHTAGGSYRPLVDLLSEAGYTVSPNSQALSGSALRDCDVLIISNPRGASAAEPMEKRAQPAFTAEETAAVSAWVRQGGALLLVADHWPIGPAAQGLAERFGVAMSGGWTHDPSHSTGKAGHLLSSGEQLGDHPIVRGRHASERVSRVMTFMGQSLEGPPGSVSLLRLSPTAVDQLPPDRRAVSAAGRSQAVAAAFGKGRVVVLGEAAMITVQAGMGWQVPGNDNRQFALNVVRWLSRQL